jgi:glutamine synthetase
MGTPLAVGYLQHNSRQQVRFVDEVLLRLDGLGIEVEGWHAEAAPGQLEINLAPDDPLRACDTVIRVKQVMREVGIDHGHCVTFMAKPSEEFGNGLHVHHSLTRDGEPVFAARDGMSETMQHWLGGLMQSAAALTAFAAPNVNSYRRLVGFAAAPTVASWGEDNKSAALRVLSQVSPNAARIEYRVAGGDANPYLVLAGVLAAGIAGLDTRATPPPALRSSGWGLPRDGYPHLPDTITRAAAALEADTAFGGALGPRFVEFWLNTRRWEWLMFHTTGGDAGAESVTDWELDRLFELA